MPLDTRALLQQRHETFVSTSSSPTSTSDDGLFAQGYVEWYWVVLGLIVPVLLGALFCLLDHFRRKKTKSKRYNESRLESMCERNKYTPPNYEDVIPNQIIIETIPDFNSPIPALVSTVQNAEPSLPSDTMVTDPPPTSPQLSVPQDVLSPDSYVEENELGDDSSSLSDDCFDDVDLATEAPPAYDDYHKYEIYGSRAQLF